MRNGTRQPPLSPVQFVESPLVDVHDGAGDDAAAAINERDGVTALELTCLDCRRDVRW